MSLLHSDYSRCVMPASFPWACSTGVGIVPPPPGLALQPAGWGSKLQDNAEQFEAKAATEMKDPAEGKGLCAVCMDKPNEYAVVPCGHKCLCEDCVEAVRQTQRICPMCRRDFQDIIKIFGL